MVPEKSDTESNPALEEALAPLDGRGLTRRVARRVRRVLGSTWVVAFVLVWVAILLFPSRTYSGGDDATIAGILHGTISGSPDPHAIFVNYGVGIVVSTLSSIWGGVGWYGIAVWGMLASAIATGIVFVKAASQEMLPRVAGVLVIIIAAMPLLLRLSFTTTSILIGGISIVGILVSTRVGKPESSQLAAASVALATLSLALRRPSFLAAGFVLAPLLIAAFISNWRLAAKSVGAIALIGVVLAGVNHAGYTSAEWTDYLQWTSARSDINDFWLDDEAAGRAASGWSKNDRTVFARSMLFDPNVHDLESTQAFADATSTVRRPLNWNSIMKHLRFWIAAGVLLVAGALSFRQRAFTNWRLLALTTLFWTFGTALAVAMFRYLPRVFDGMLAVGVFGATVALTMGRAEGSLTRRHVGAAALLLVALFPLGVDNVAMRARNIISIPSSQSGPKSIAALKTLPSGTVFVGEAGAVLNRWDPLQSLDVRSELDYQSAASWAAFSPVWFERSRNLGVLDIPRALVDNPKVLYLAVRKDSEKRVQTFLSDHYGIDSVPCEVPISGYRHKAWRFVSASSGCP